MLLELLERNPAAERRAVVQDVKVQPLGVDDDLAVRPDEPRSPQGPLSRDLPIEHRGAGGDFVELERCDALKQVQ